MDPDAVPAGQPGDHEQAEPVGVGEVELLLHGEALVDLAEVLLVQAETAVVDLQAEAVRDDLALDGDLGLRRGEHRGVLDEFGDQVGDVGDGGAEQAGAGERPDDDPGVVLDLADGGAHHVDHPDRLAPGAAGRAAGEDDQALGVAAHAGGEVVEAEQVLEFARVLGAALHRVQQGELTVQQHLGAAGQVDEDRGDAAAQFGLFDGGLDGDPLDLVEGPADLADLARAELELGDFGDHVDGFAAAQPEHHGGQPVGGQVGGGVAQADEFAHQAAADAVGDDDGEHHGEQADQAGDGAAQQGVDGVGVGLVADLGDQPVVDGVDVGEDPVGVLAPGVGSAADLAGPVGGVVEAVFGGGEGAPGLAGAQFVVVGLVLRVEFADVDPEQGLLGVHGVEHDLLLAGIGGGGGAAGPQGAHRGGLLRQVVGAAGEFDQDGALPGQRAALLRDEGGAEGEHRADQVAVVLERAVPALPLLADLAADGGELLGDGEDVADPGALVAVELVGVAAAGLVAQQLEVPVGDGLGLQVGVGVGLVAGVGEPEHGGGALDAQVVGVLVGGGAEGLVGGADVELVPHVAGGDQRGVAPQSAERRDGHQEQRDDPRADRAAAQAHTGPLVVLGRWGRSGSDGRGQGWVLRGTRAASLLLPDHPFVG